MSAGGWDLSGWDVYDLGERTLRRINPPRRVLVHMQAALPPGVGRPPTTGQPLYVRAAGVRLELWMPAEQHAWLRAATGRWWALVSVDARASNKLSRLTIPMFVAHEHLVLDTAETRAQHDVDRRPPWITSRE